MVNLPTNSTGWPELMNGTLVKASFVVYDTALKGWTIGILFIVFELMLIIKTRNAPAVAITSLLAVSLIIAYMNTQAAAIMIMILVFFLAGIVYFLFFK